MKLIDLLVKKTNEDGWCWPGKSTFCYQTKPEYGYITKFFDRNGVKVVDYRWEKCDDASAFNELTKEQYEAALAKNDGWIEWGGGECPLERGAIVDVKHRDGGIFLNAKALVGKAENWNQGETEHPGDIIAYRPQRDINSRANDDRLEQDLNGGLIGPFNSIEECIAYADKEREQDLNECIGASEAQVWNGDGVPPIGCACEMQDSKGTWLPVVIIAKNDGFTFGWSYDYRLVFFGDKDDEFRPLRTEAERKHDDAKKAISELRDRDGYKLAACMIDPIYDAIAAGRIPGVKLENK